MLDDISLKDTYELPPPIIDSAKELKELNLDSELLTNYQSAKEYLEQIRYDESTQPNQVAQVMNTINAILKEIVKMQTELYDAERVKKMELALVATMKAQPVDVQRQFFELYDENLHK